MDEKEESLGGWRSWLPVPTGTRRIELTRWVLLEGNRHAVTLFLLSITFISVLLIGTLWTFEIQRLLTETAAVQTLLDSFMSGIILLVSIVVSINSIVVSYDITDVSSQQDRIEGSIEFRQELARTTESEEVASDPRSFLGAMAAVIHDRAKALEEVVEEGDEAFANEVQDYIESISQTVTTLENSLYRLGGAEFGLLWLGLEADYGPLMNRSRKITSTYQTQLNESTQARFNDLIQALEMFAIGREYFKTLYYTNEISQLSRTLLIISLPSIIITASTILAINAKLLPDFWLFGLPPLLTFVAVAFTIALAPYIVLTAFMLRVATVARKTVTAGPFSLRP